MRIKITLEIIIERSNPFFFNFEKFEKITKI